MINTKRLIPVLSLVAMLNTTAFAAGATGEANAPTAIQAVQGISIHNTMNIGVLVIGDSAYKADHFMSELREMLPDDAAGRYKIISGNEVQSKYQSYWLDKGFLDEKQPTPDTLKEFVKYSGYDKVVYILLKDSQLDKNQSASSSGGFNRKGGGWFGVAETNNRAYIEARVFLVNAEKILQNCNVTTEDDSKASELRARRGAFKKCIREINNKLAMYFADR